MKVAEIQSAPTEDIGNHAALLRTIAERTLDYDFSVWFWGDAIAIDGLLEAAGLLDNGNYIDFCRRYFERWSKRKLSWADHLTPGAALLRLYRNTGDGLFLDSAIRLAHWLKSAPKARCMNAHLYRPDIPAYRHTVWVDTLYHEPPFFCLLAHETGDNSYFDDALEIWNTHVNTLSSDKGPFLAHAHDTGSHLLRGYGWGRGNGWALLGMVDTLELLPKNHPGYEGALCGFRNLSKAVLAMQDASGFWRTLLSEEEVYLESSTAAFFGTAFAKGVRIKLLDPGDLSQREVIHPGGAGHCFWWPVEDGGTLNNSPRHATSYSDSVELAWRAMLSRIRSDGSFFGVSACTYAATAPGDDLSLYRTLPTEVNVWGQGSVLRFVSERIRSGLR